MRNEQAGYAIGELAALAGTTPRTVRYYVAQGLLPAPSGAGAGAHYTDQHLGRLRLIRRLQRQHQPLAEIRERLRSLGDREIAGLVAGEEPDATPPSSALEYLRDLLAPSAGATPASPPAVAPVVAAESRLPHPAPAVGPAIGGPRLLRRAIPAMPSLRASETTAAYGPAAPDAAEERSQWDRIALTPNIEIHVRRPLGRLENRRVERLITIARQVLREEQL
jgi:DNA-binding transcriptional MerR regulator